jgi:thiol-disulfide isomerase/thioredoxin
MSLKRSLVLGLVAGLAVSQAAIAQDAPVVVADPQPADATAAPTAALKAGDAAPALKLAKWVKGTEVKTFEKDKVYVVEFWATWCGPCRRTIPHLTKLAKEMKDKVTVIGVSVWETQPGETGTDYIAKVEKFVTNMGEKMEYNVAADTGEGDMAKTWMEASGSQGIPTAFVVGKTGKIEWIGHPMEGLDQVVADVYAGTYDASKAEAIRAAAEKKMADRQEAMMKVMQLNEEGKAAEALAELDKIAAGETDDDAKLELSVTRFMLLSKSDEAAATKLAKELSEGAAKENAQMLYAMSSMMLEGTDFKTPDYALVVSMATKAAELHRKENDNKDHPALLSLVAKAQFKSGNVDGAIASQEAAIKLIDEMGPGVPEEAKTDFKAALDEYKAAKK